MFNLDLRGAIISLTFLSSKNSKTANHTRPEKIWIQGSEEKESVNIEKILSRFVDNGETSKDASFTTRRIA